jgi:hypothetical protein
VQIPRFVDQQGSEVVLLLGCDPSLADEDVGLLGVGLAVVAEEQLGVHVQPRDVALRVHVEPDGFEGVEHLEFVALLLVAQGLGVELHLEFEFFVGFQDPAGFFDVLPFG